MTVLVALLALLGAPSPGLTARGTELVLTTADGRILKSADLVGAQLELDGRLVRIASVRRDAEAFGGEVWLHDFIIVGGTEDGEPLCEADASGVRSGFPLLEADGTVSLVCTSGAVGKCVRFGYRPWEERPGGTPMKLLHEACVKMVRAEYGGDGQSYTREGVRISFCDRFGVRPCPKTAPIEAAWGTKGATCVARPRRAELTSLEQLGKRYPKLRARLGASSCTFKGAWSARDTVLVSW